MDRTHPVGGARHTVGRRQLHFVGRGGREMMMMTMMTIIMTIKNNLRFAELRNNRPCGLVTHMEQSD